MDNFSIDEKIKVEPKKKIKLSKPKKNLILLDESEENFDQLNEESNGIYTKRHLNLKNKLSETRFNALSNYNTINNTEDDVFDDNISLNLNKSINGQNSKAKQELNEVMDLLNEVKDQDFNRNNCEHNDSNDLIVLLDFNQTNDGFNQTSDDFNTNTNNRYNTRSNNKGNKTKPKNTNKKNNKKNKNKKSVIDEQQIFDKLDVMECMEDIECLEDIEEIESRNSSMIVSEDVEMFMHSRNIEIKVKYKAIISKFSMKQNDKFSSIMPLIALKYNEDISHLILRLNDSIISADSTPQSIGLNIWDIIDCHKRVKNDIQTNDPNVLTLKLRDSSKDIITITITKFDKVSKIMDLFSQQKGLALNKFSLEFDGERLDPNNTINDCDIDDDSQIDVIYQ
jgi:hypothetical protein